MTTTGVRRSQLTYAEYIRKPYEGFRRTTVNDSPFLRENIGRVEVVPRVERDQEFGFNFRSVDGREIGDWTFRVVEGRLADWESQPDLFFLRSHIFGLHDRFKRKNHPTEWLAAAFRQTVFRNYLVPAYSGWVMMEETKVPEMVKVNEGAHGIDHKVEVSPGAWHLYILLQPTT